MKPTANSQHDLSPILAFGAHPDDIEFGCGGVIARETNSGRAVHFVVCSKGEAGTNGSPDQRVKEAQAAAAILGATIEFIELDGDAHLEIKSIHAIKLAGIIRRIRPGVVLAPTTVQNQHPDHWRLGTLVRDAARLARYGGIAELRETPRHSIDQLLFYGLGDDAQPRDIQPVLVDVSQPQIIDTWTRSMEAHASQMATRAYVDLQLTRARANGARAGVSHAIPLFPNDPIVIDSLSQIARSARQF